uniref:Uncharacterized protein n=1 Tax=Romanomermis culicivorax TaxID=13658 RepID=A0A915K5N9_ROMCU
MGADSSNRVGANDEMSSSVSFRKSLIWAAKAVRSAVANGSCGASRGAAGGSFAILRSKIGILSSSSSHGSGAVDNIGRSSNSSAVSVRPKAVIGSKYA